ncbi:hypothetical protein KAX06_07685 [candidate division WOR-3 bacterium]|nr:hypothetical protein [candidate division WOR-3 bacterium]
MKKFFGLRWWIVLLIYIFLDVIAVGAGMGVPILCIVLGFPVGWYIARRSLLSEYRIGDQMRRIFQVALATSLFTFAVMAILWGRTVSLLFDPASDFANFGIPMILYDPKASFAGWLILMIFVFPFLQLLTTTFAAYLTVAIKANRG